MDHLNRPPGCILASFYSLIVNEASQVPAQNSLLPIHHSTLWTNYSPSGLYLSGKRGKQMALKQDIRLPQYLDDWLIWVSSCRNSYKMRLNLTEVHATPGIPTATSVHIQIEHQAFSSRVSNSKYPSMNSGCLKHLLE